MKYITTIVKTNDNKNIDRLLTDWTNIVVFVLQFSEIDFTGREIWCAYAKLKVWKAFMRKNCLWKTNLIEIGVGEWTQSIFLD